VADQIPGRDIDERYSTDGQGRAPKPGLHLAIVNSVAGPDPAPHGVWRRPCGGKPGGVAAKGIGEFRFSDYARDEVP